MPRPLALALAAFFTLSGTSAVSAGRTAAAGAVITVGTGVSPVALQVTSGTTVRWVNRDDERHRFRSEDGPQEFDTGNLEPGESYTVTLRSVGVYRYLDERDDDDTRYHGTITVRPGATATAAPPDRGTPGAQASGPGTATPSAPGVASVTIGDRVFSPATVTIAEGGRVEFSNNDDRPHTATGDAWDTGVLDSGGSAATTFPTAGTFAYLCAIHPEMTGTVVVKAQAGASGTPPRPAATRPAATPRPGRPPTPAPASTSPDDPSAPAAAEPAVIQLVDFAFSPASLSVPAGTAVEFRNDGEAMHTATAQDESFDTGFLDAGASARQTFAAPGTYPFLCVLHPDMRGTISVTAGTDAGPDDARSPTPSARTVAPAAGSTAATEASPPPAAASPPASAGPSEAAAAGVAGPVAAGAAAEQPAAEPDSVAVRAPTAERRTSTNLGGLGIAVALAVAAVFAFGLLVRGVAGSEVR